MRGSFFVAGFVYIIYSEKWDQFYVGSTENVDIRLSHHNTGRNKSTRGGEPWVLSYTEAFEQINEARRRELEIKRKKSRAYIEWLISKAG
jgi:putative endonuclease